MGVFSRPGTSVSTSTSRPESIVIDPPPTPALPPGSLFGVAPPRPPLRNPGWRDRITEHTAWSFAGGLVSGAAYALYTESLDFTPAIAAVTCNITVIGGAFACVKETTRLVRQKDDWVNSMTGGAVVGSACATVFKGRPYSPAGAFVFGGIAGGTHFLMAGENTEWLCTLVGFRTIKKGNGVVDWVTPNWFPIKRISDETLASNEIEFQMRVNAVLEGRVDSNEADLIRKEYRKRREVETLRAMGKTVGEPEAEPATTTKKWL